GLPQMIADPDWDFLALVVGTVAVLCVMAFASGWLLARLLRADAAEERSLVFGLGMNNNGTGMVLACSALAGMPGALLPALAYNLVQHVAASGFHHWLTTRNRDRLTHPPRQGRMAPRVFPPIPLSRP